MGEASVLLYRNNGYKRTEAAMSSYIDTDIDTDDTHDNDKDDDDDGIYRGAEGVDKRDEERAGGARCRAAADCVLERGHSIRSLVVVGERCRLHCASPSMCKEQTKRGE